VITAYEHTISDYALIGDTRTAALVSSRGSIDWMCVPRFDGEPIFGRLIGGEKSGSFSLRIDEVTNTTRRYLPRSGVLETQLRSTGGTGRMVEGMVAAVSNRLLPQLILVRRVECRQGSVSLRVNFDPKLGLPGQSPTRVARRGGTLVCEWGSLAVGLAASPDIDVQVGYETKIDLRAGSSLTVVMTLSDRSPVVLLSPERGYDLLRTTDRWWNEWASTTTYDGPFTEAVLRSLITLRLLTFSPSGAPVAAPTTSLPEVIGGKRNWDYRFSWPRDASIGLAAFISLGKEDEAHSFMHWLLHAGRLSRPRLRVLYTLYGKDSPAERELKGVTGYRSSLPVRTGNAACAQHQLDVYGWVLDAAWLLSRAGHRLHGETWRALSSFADFVAGHWRDPDAGIWEVRSEPAHYVHSKLMAWLCLDRALRIAVVQRTPAARTKRWSRERELLSADIRTHGFDDERGVYVRSYGSSDLDAALLILPILDFEDDQAKVKATIAAIRRRLEPYPGMVYRYRPGSDSLTGIEGAFLPCAFWLVQALARTGELEEATELFGRLLGHANDVGLFAEEADPITKEHLGNYPQAFTHAALIQAALSLSEEGQTV
jgi:GH15 family glucan-1,4-alpha-glucosidase